MFDAASDVGPLVNFFIGQKLGRRRAMWLAATIIIIGAILQCSAFTLAHLIVGRIVTGIGTGIETSTVPMYQVRAAKSIDNLALLTRSSLAG